MLKLRKCHLAAIGNRNARFSPVNLDFTGDAVAVRKRCETLFVCDQLGFCAARSVRKSEQTGTDTTPNDASLDQGKAVGTIGCALL